MFVTFEGIEGTGKSTQVARLAAWLREQGREVLVTREPGGSRLGVELRRILLDVSSADLTPAAELYLYLADRAQHVATVIRPALEAGRVVLCDRFADSNIVYQGYGRGLDPLRLFELNTLAVGDYWPGLSILLDIEPVVGLARAQERLLRDGKLATEGRFEAESMAFHERIRRGYLDWAGRHPQRFRIVDAMPPPEAVAAEIRDCVAQALAKEQGP